MRQIVQVAYMTVEDECAGCGENIKVWVTSYVHKTSKIEEWKRPPLAQGGLSVLQHKGDEAATVWFQEEDGRLCVIVWPVPATFTKEQLNADIQRHIDDILAERMPNPDHLVPADKPKEEAK